MSIATPTICFANQKGGVGKTALTNLAAQAFAKAGYRVGVRDTDVEQCSLTRDLERPALKGEPNIQPAPPGANGFDVIVIDCPRSLSDRAFIAAVEASSLICLVSGPAPKELEITGDTYRKFCERLPHKRVALLLNRLRPDTNLVMQSLKQNLVAYGLKDAPRIKNTLPALSRYEQATTDGIVVLPAPARETLLQLAAELFLLASKTS